MIVEQSFLAEGGLSPERIVGNFEDKWIDAPNEILADRRAALSGEKERAAALGKTFDNNGTYSLHRVTVRRPEGSNGSRENQHLLEMRPSDYEHFVFPNSMLDRVPHRPERAKQYETIRDLCGLDRHKLRFDSIQDLPYHFRIGVNGVFITSDGFVVLTCRSRSQLIAAPFPSNRKVELVHMSVAEGMYRSKNSSEEGDTWRGGPHPYATLIRAADHELGIDENQIKDTVCLCLAMDQSRAQPIVVFFSNLYISIKDVFKQWQERAKDKHESKAVIGLPWNNATVYGIFSGADFSSLSGAYPEEAEQLSKPGISPLLASNHAQLSLAMAARHSLAE